MGQSLLFINPIFFLYTCESIFRYPSTSIDDQFRKFFQEYTLKSPFVHYINNEELFSRIREKQLGQPTTRQSQVAMNIARANIVTDEWQAQHIEPNEINQQSRAPGQTHGKKLIVHYTHEKRFHSLKREIHQIYNDVFKNSPVADVKSIVGTRNRRDARNDLIRKRPQRALLQNKPRKSE